MNDLVVKEVNFQNINMTACKTVEGKILVGIKSVCEGLGVDNSSQFKRIQRDEVLSTCVVKITIELSGQNREVSFMELEALPLFLTGITSSMCREEIKPKLKEFKLRAKDVLAQAFLHKGTTNNYNIEFVKEINKALNNIQDKDVRDSICRQMFEKIGFSTSDIINVKVAVNVDKQLNIVQGFLEDICIKDKSSLIAVGDLYELFSKWCKNKNYYYISGVLFGKKLRKLGFEQFRTSTCRFWQGLNIK